MFDCTYLVITRKEGSVMTSLNLTTSRRDIERFLRVDHAGERAAQQIYKGQLAVLANHEMANEIRHMMDQEVEHLETFDSLLNERKVRPSLLDPLWGAAGFTLGVVTAAMGPKAAMACTIAVEEVIGEHYQKQADTLGEDERDLHAIVERFRDEELEHRDIAVDHEGREARYYELLRSVIQRGCRTAIKIAEKI
jgi:ubiquinone biosynthesis monooxygenase Coq7